MTDTEAGTQQLAVRDDELELDRFEEWQRLASAKPGTLDRIAGDAGPLIDLLLRADNLDAVATILAGNAARAARACDPDTLAQARTWAAAQRPDVTRAALQLVVATEQGVTTIADVRAATEIAAAALDDRSSSPAWRRRLGWKGGTR